MPASCIWVVSELPASLHSLHNVGRDKKLLNKNLVLPNTNIETEAQGKSAYVRIWSKYIQIQTSRAMNEKKLKSTLPRNAVTNSLASPAYPSWKKNALLYLDMNLRCEAWPAKYVYTFLVKMSSVASDPCLFLFQPTSVIFLRLFKDNP